MTERARPGVLERLGLHRQELRAWAMYDWANSAFMTTIIAAVFPVFYATVAASGLGEGEAETRFTAATTASIVVAAVLAPILGTMADLRPVKKRFLAAFMVLGASAIAGMFFIGHGDWQLALVLFSIANIGAMGSFVFYDALLPHVAREDEVDRVSTAGYALGYVGGGCLLAVQLAWILSPATFGLPAGDDLTPEQATLPARLALASVALWWVVFSIPLFLRVREPAVVLQPHEVGANPVGLAFRRLYETFRELRGYRQAAIFLLAFLIFGDGIGTIIRLAVIYGTVIGIEQNTLITAILITQFVGIPCAFGFGWLAGRIGAKRAILLGLVVYMGITVFAFFMTVAWHFLALAVLVGMVQGGTQALSRSLFAAMIPRHKSGEFFGLFGVIERFSGSVGTATVGALVAVGLPMRFGMLAVIAFFALGAVVLLWVRVDEGRREAEAAERALLARGEARAVGGAATPG